MGGMGGCDVRVRLGDLVECRVFLWSALVLVRREREVW